MNIRFVRCLAKAAVCGLVLTGVVSPATMAASPGAHGGEVSAGPAERAGQAAGKGDTCRNTRQLYRCVGVSVHGSTSFSAYGYISDYKGGRNFKVGVSRVRLQKWNYTKKRWQTKKAKPDYDGFHGRRDSAYIHPRGGCHGKWRTVAKFSWHRVGKSKVRTKRIKSKPVWCA